MQRMTVSLLCIYYSILLLSECVTSVPGPPRGVAVDVVNQSHILVTWTPLSPVEARGYIIHYTVYYWPSSNRTMIMSITVKSNITRYLISNLSLDVNYKVQVSASTSVGEGDKSEAKEIQIYFGSVKKGLFKINQELKNLS